MSIDRIQPPASASASWQPDEYRPAESRGVPAVPSAGAANLARPEQTATPARSPEENAAALTEAKKPALKSAVASIEMMAQKLKALQAQSQTDKEITSLDQELYATRQELAKVAHEKLLAEAGTQSAEAENSYWSGLDVVDKARTINKLKDRLEELELERSALVKQAAQQLQDGTYRVSGAEILAGMLEELV